MLVFHPYYLAALDNSREKLAPFLVAAGAAGAAGAVAVAVAVAAVVVVVVVLLLERRRCDVYCICFIL